MRKIIFIIVVLIFITFSLLFPQITISGASNGLLIWFEEIIPTLLPFIILSNIIMDSNLLAAFTNSSNDSSQIISYLIIALTGFLLGMPIGAVMVVHFYQNKQIGTKQAGWLLACCNTLSPFYISGYVCNTYLSHLSGLVLFVAIYLPAILVLVINYCVSKKTNVHIKKSTSRFHLTFQIIDAGIMNGFEVVTKLGGYIIIFGIIAAYIKKLTMLPSILQGILLITMEITNGVHFLGNMNLHTNILCLILIPSVVFGGLCTHAQTYTIISKTDLSPFQYTAKKLLLSMITLIILLFLNLYVIPY